MDLPAHIRTINAKAKCLYTKAQVETALDQMAIEITAVLADVDPLFLCVLVGGIVPVGNLLPRLNFPLEVDYIHVTRYQGATQGGELKWKAKPTRSIKDRTIVIVDDILDGGTTLSAVMEYCQQQQAKAVYTAVLVDRNRAREKDGLQRADFTGLTVDDVYVYGYGLDYKEYLRNAPGIFAVPSEEK